METTIFAPLGKRVGFGTYETFWDVKYGNMENAFAENDYVIVDFVADPDGVIYFQYYHVQKPDEKRHYKLGWQNFVPSLGVDSRDDWEICELAQQLFL